MAKALKMVSVGPVMVTILSGQLPSEILIRAPLWEKQNTRWWGERNDVRHLILEWQLRMIYSPLTNL